MRLRALLLALCFAYTSAAGYALQEKKEAKKAPAAAEKKKEEKKDDKKDAKAESDKPKDPMSSGTFSGLKLRSIGPAMVSGRVAALAVDPHHREHYFVGVASGGVWKTTNDGTTFTPVFDGEGSYSIGAVSIDPRDSNIVWVGSGENNSQRSVAYGDGVYRSEDGGKSWKNMGLKKSEHIGRVLIDPNNSDVVYVAAQGPLWAPGGDRGLYKTTDGGKTWKAVLTISENTGVSEVVMDPRDSNVLYASAYQRRRTQWTLIDGGTESAIYKSNDGGTTWNKLTNGLPGEDKGRIGLAIAPSNPDMIYATVEAANSKGGVFRSSDRGATWEKRNDFSQGAMYYSGITVDPQNPDRIYIMNTFIMTSDDGGKTLRRMRERYKHVDSHVMWIDPMDSDFMIVGCDGGVYQSYDRGETWRWRSNLPVSQFYDVAVDNTKPFYYVYGGTQDNNSLGGPSRTISASGITNSDWFITQGGDGFRSQVDPEDPNTIYAEAQYGAVIRYDRRTGQQFGIQPQPGKGEPGLKWNWDSPLLVSSHKHTRIYFAANILFRSEDRGDSWKAISPDLTRQIDRDTLPVMGKIQPPDAVAKHQSTSLYGEIVAFAESPKNEGLLAVGTNDGLVQVTENGGGAWKKIESFPGVPDRTFVSRLAFSHHNERTLYASFDNHKAGDFKPYLLKSTDAGASWTSIASNLPENGEVLAIAEDYVNPNLIFVGTEHGLFFTVDGGGKWIQLKGGLPTIAVRDAVIHKGMSDLVIATFGRGFYILDDITPLRLVKPAMLEQESALLPVRDTMLFLEKLANGGRGKAHFGEDFFYADNPSYGATFTYFLKEKYKTLKEKRQDAEKEAAKKNDGAAYPALKYPSYEELRAEADEEAPSLWLTVMDDSGNIVNRVPASNSPGMNRTAWHLRYPAVELFEPRGEEIYPWDFGPVGPLVMPGKYAVKLSKKVGGQWSDMSAPVNFNVYVDGADKMAADDAAVLHAFQKKVASLDRAVSGAISSGNELNGKLRSMRRALNQTPADTSALMKRLDTLERQLRPVMIALRGDIFLRQRQENTPQSINDRVNQIEGDQRLSTARPSQTNLDDYTIASGEFSEQLNKLHGLLADTKQLEDDMEKIGAPWTSGRVPQWQEK